MAAAEDGGPSPVTEAPALAQPVEEDQATTSSESAAAIQPCNSGAAGSHSETAQRSNCGPTKTDDKSRDKRHKKARPQAVDLGKLGVGGASRTLTPLAQSGWIPLLAAT